LKIIRRESEMSLEEKIDEEIEKRQSEKEKL